jgi:hypothetical protein
VNVKIISSSFCHKAANLVPAWPSPGGWPPSLEPGQLHLQKPKHVAIVKKDTPENAASQAARLLALG